MDGIVSGGIVSCDGISPAGNEPLGRGFPESISVCGVMPGNLSDGGLTPVDDSASDIGFGVGTAAGDVLLPYTLPQAEYMYGCVATSVGMLLGYYDLYGCQVGTVTYDMSGLIPGTISVSSRGSDGTSVYNMKDPSVLANFIASDEYADRFYQTSPSEELPYTFVNGDPAAGLNVSVWNCLADYLGTGQYWRGNGDLATTYYYADLAWLDTTGQTYSVGGTAVPAKFVDFKYGLSLYVGGAGYALDAAVTESFSNSGGESFTFDDLMAEIDAGRPVLLSIRSGGSGHMVTVCGYNAGTREVIFDDCYNSGCRMAWDGTYLYSNNVYTIDGATTVVFDTTGLTAVGVSAIIAGNFTAAGGAFQLLDNGVAAIRSASGRRALSEIVDADRWEVVGAGDFSGGGTDGLLWLEKDTGYVYMQNDTTGFDEVTDKTNCLGVVCDGYALKAAGDFTGNGIEGALLQGPAFGDPEISLNYGLPVWARNDDGSAFNGWLGALVNTWQPGDPPAGDPADPADINARNYKYDVIGVGDFNGDGVDDVMLQNTMPTEVDGVVITGSGDVFTFLTGDKAAIIAGDPPTVSYAGCAAGGWEVVGFGDFDGDGIDDALLSDGTGVAGWSMADGQRQGDLWFGNLSEGDEFAGIADFDGDGTEDILIRSTATETLTAWLVQAGSVTGTLAIA